MTFRTPRSTASSPAPRIFFALFILSISALIGCGGEGEDGVPSPRSSANGTVDSDTSTTISLDASSGIRGRAPGEADPDAGSAFSCEPAQPVCLSPTEWARCDYDGRGYGIVHTCSDGHACDAALRVCKPVFCEPGSLRCVSQSDRKRCNATGTGLEDELVPCEAGLSCSEVEGEAICSPCRPGAMYCAGLTEAARCDDEGQESVPGSEVSCPEGEVCRLSDGTCVPPVCEPNSLRCASAFSVKTCDAHGSDWLDNPVFCQQDYVCQTDSCVYRPCLDNVLFVVDRSGSMEGLKWEQARDAVVQVVNENPDALFGLKAFPSSGCAVTSQADVPIASGLDQTAQLLGDWFDANPPEGSTPLVGVLDRIASSTDQYFGTYGGAIIVVSDGGESCTDDNVLGRLGQAASALYTAHQISTYVIGFDFDVAPQQLNTIAFFGGSSMSNYIPVTETDSLADAFQGILDDFKLCGSFD